LGSLIGILLASQIPRDWGIGFAGTLVLLGLTIPLIVNRATLAGVIVASGVAVAASGLPYRFGLVVAMLAGIAASVTIDRITGSATDQEQGKS
jgi:predicted branched-subunit amino acid permease